MTSHELNEKAAELLAWKWKGEDLFTETHGGRLQVSYVYRHHNDIREFSPATSIADAMDLLDAMPGGSKFYIDEDSVSVQVAGSDKSYPTNYHSPGERARAIAEAFIAATEASK